MPFPLRTPLVPLDVPSLASNIMAAFYEDPHWRLLWGGLPLDSIIEGTAHRLARALTSGRDRKRHQVALDPETGRVVGYARWVLSPALVRAAAWLDAQVAEPTTEAAEAYAVEADLWMEDGHAKGANAHMIAALNVKLGAEDAKLKGRDEWLELDYLAVRPEYQEQGIGEQLVRSGVAEADRYGVYTVVMASTMRGQSLYRRCGLRLISTIVQDDRRWGGTESGSVNCWYKRDVPSEA